MCRSRGFFFPQASWEAQPRPAAAWHVVFEIKAHNVGMLDPLPHCMAAAPRSVTLQPGPSHPIRVSPRLCPDGVRLPPQQRQGGFAVPSRVTASPSPGATRGHNSHPGEGVPWPGEGRGGRSGGPGATRGPTRGSPTRPDPAFPAGRAGRGKAGAGGGAAAGPAGTLLFLEGKSVKGSGRGRPRCPEWAGGGWRRAEAGRAGRGGGRAPGSVTRSRAVPGTRGRALRPL